MQEINKHPTAFLSYSHADKEFADKLSQDLFAAGIQVWNDTYEIRPGDSIIEKIFAEGLAKSKFFLILLSQASTNSKWVQEELSAAMISRIEGVTNIIPVLKEACEIPLQLRSIKWVDLSLNYEGGIRELVKAIHDVHEKPVLGTPPEYVAALKQSVGGLSKEASTVGRLLLSTEEDERGFDKRFWSRDLHALLPALSAEEFNDAIDELESAGLVKAHKVMGNKPYYFGDVVATYLLFLHFKEEGLGYDPVQDIKSIAAAVASKKELKGADLQEIVKITPGRINRAVAYLDDYGYVRTIRTMGTRPYGFRDVIATRHTRQFVQENCQ